MMIGTGPNRGQDEEENLYSARPGTKNYQALPEDSSGLQQLAQRAGANTRLKSAAMSLVAAGESVAVGESSREQDLMLHLPLALQDEEAGDAEDEGAITAPPTESPLHRVNPHFASNMADQVTTEELMRRIEERDSRIDQMATQMSTMMDAMNTLLRQQQQQQTHHQSAQQSHSTEQAVNVNPHNTEHQASPYQQNLTVNERASHEVPISAMTPSALQQLLDSIVTSKVKQLSQDKEPLLTEGDKPYPAWHDHVPYPPNYNRPRFQMFDGTGDAREHLTHFEAACGDVATNPSLLLRQFSLSLKGAAFHWYTKLAPGSVLDWDMMKALFKAHFISVKRDISLGELAELKQGRDERVEDYVARWRNMSILYPDELKPTQAVELCIKGMQSWYSMEVSRYKPTNITDLMIAAGKVELEYQRSPEILALYKNAKAIDNTRKALPQKTANSGGGGPSRKVTEANVVHPPRSASQNREKMPITSETPVRKSQSWIEERKNKTYSFKREKVPRIFEQVMKTKKLVLPEPTKPEEVHKTDDPLYYPYHRSVGHKIEDCFIFKDWVERALRQGVFTLSPKAKNDPNVDSSNMVTIKEARASLPASENSNSSRRQVSILPGISSPSTEEWMPASQLMHFLEHPTGQSNTYIDEQEWVTIVKKKPSKSSGKILASNISCLVSQVPISSSNYVIETKKKQKKSGKKKSRRNKRKALLSESEEYVQMARNRIVLDDFMPKGWRIDDSLHDYDVIEESDTASDSCFSEDIDPDRVKLNPRLLCNMVQAEFTTKIQGANHNGVLHNITDEVCIFPNEFSEDDARFPGQLEVNEMNLRSGKHLPDPQSRSSGSKNINEGKSVSTSNDRSLPNVPTPHSKD